MTAAVPVAQAPILSQPQVACAAPGAIPGLNHSPPCRWKDEDGMPRLPPLGPVPASAQA